MPHPLKMLLDRRGRSAAANINATFVAYGDADYCTVTLRDTGVTVLAKLAVSAQMTPGQEVIVSRPDGSGRSANTNYTVIALAGASAPGSSPAVTQAQNHPGATITSIAPLPAIVDAGAAVDVVVRGTGFTAVPAFEITQAYGDANIFDNAPTDVSDSEIDLHVTIGFRTPPGDHSLALGTLRTEDAYFQVGAPASYPASLWVEVVSGDALRLLRVDPESLAVIDGYTFEGSLDYFDQPDGFDFARIDDVVYAMSAASVMRVRQGTGVLLGEKTGLDSAKVLDVGQATVSGSTLLYGGFSSDVIHYFDTVGISESTHFVDTGGSGITGVAIDPGDSDIAWFMLNDQGVGGTYGHVIKWRVSTFAELLRAELPAADFFTGRRIAVDASYVYVLCDEGVWQLNKSDLSLSNSTTTGALSANALSLFALINGKAWGCDAYSDLADHSGKFFKLDPTTMNVTQINLGTGIKSQCFAYHAGQFWVGDRAGGITPVNETTFVLGTRRVIASEELRRIFYA